MTPYLDMLRKIREKGIVRDDRTKTGTVGLFGEQMVFDLNDGFPLTTTKKLFTRGVIHELLWFLQGDTNISYLTENNVHIWDEWADEDSNLGPVYGKQWRAWETKDGRSVDQLANVIKEIKEHPESRRLIVNAWNVGDIDEMALPPCHMMFQLYVAEGKLSCKLTQRSADFFLGVPFNIASYALLTHMIAQQCCLGVDKFIWSGGDCHIYLNHLDQVDEQLSRSVFKLPTLRLNKAKDISSYTIDDFQFDNYQCHPTIKADISV